MESLAHLPAWQRRRAERLDAACRAVHDAVAAGEPLHSAFARLATAHDRTPLDDDGGPRLLRLSAASLRRHYAAWRTNPTWTVFACAYKAPPPRVPRDLIDEYQRRATLPGQTELSVAYQTLVRDWSQGLALPGLGTWRDYYRRHHPAHPIPHAAPDFPYSYRTFLRHQPTAPLRTLGNRGQAEARKLLPCVERNYASLRPCELYVLDDVRLDLVCLDDATGRPLETRCYVMLEAASRLIAAFVLRPANAILARDVDACLARGLAALGLGHNYPTHILFERGTVACSSPAQTLLEHASQGAIVIHRTSLDGGSRAHPGTHRETSTGHWMGKGVIESFMHCLHLALRPLPGQRGPSWDRAPASLGFAGLDASHTPGSLAWEAEKLAQIELASGRRLRLELGLLTFTQVSAAVRAAIKTHNETRGRSYTGHGTITQCEVAPGVWEDLPAAPAA